MSRSKSDEIGPAARYMFRFSETFGYVNIVAAPWETIFFPALKDPFPFICIPDNRAAGKLNRRLSPEKFEQHRDAFPSGHDSRDDRLEAVKHSSRNLHGLTRL